MHVVEHLLTNYTFLCLQGPKLKLYLNFENFMLQPGDSMLVYNGTREKGEPPKVIANFIGVIG